MFSYNTISFPGVEPDSEFLLVVAVAEMEHRIDRLGVGVGAISVVPLMLFRCPVDDNNKNPCLLGLGNSSS
jgi:hypothetical protein